MGGTSSISGGGAITAAFNDVLVLSSVFELNEASNGGGAAEFDGANVAWYNNKELLFGNDALDCDGVASAICGAVCKSVGDNFSIVAP